MAKNSPVTLASLFINTGVCFFVAFVDAAVLHVHVHEEGSLALLGFASFRNDALVAVRNRAIADLLPC